ENGRVAKKYLDYLVDIYTENTGEYKGGKIRYQSEYKVSEEAFIDIYFELCCQQLKDAEQEFWTKGIRKKAEEKFEQSQREGWQTPFSNSVEDWEDELKHGYLGHHHAGLGYPFNDGRVLFEILLPLHSARMSFLTADLGNAIRQYRPTQSPFDWTIYDGFLEDEELVPKWSSSGTKYQSNKNLVSFYELDFLFWDGQEFISIELDGNSKKLSDYSAKKENLEKCNNLTLRNLANRDLEWLINHFSSESSPDLEYRTETLSALFSEPVLKFWETVEEESPITKLFNKQEWDKNHHMYDTDDYKYSFSARKKRLDEEIYPQLPWHLRYPDGYVYFDDPTE
ncbi:hypothetical protein, partial [Synechocystis salina]